MIARLLPPPQKGQSVWLLPEFPNALQFAPHWLVTGDQADPPISPNPFTILKCSVRRIPCGTMPREVSSDLMKDERTLLENSPVECLLLYFHASPSALAIAESAESRTAPSMP